MSVSVCMSARARVQVLGDDKKKFKTRSGEVTKLVDLLDEAVMRCRAVLQDRMGTEGSTTQV